MDAILKHQIPIHKSLQNSENEWQGRQLDIPKYAVKPKMPLKQILL